MTMHERRAAAAAAAGHHAPSDRRVAPGSTPPPPAPVSWDEFLAWLDEDVRAEWVDGAIIAMSPANAVHQLMLGFLYRLLMAASDRLPGTAVFIAGFPMRLRRQPSGREPDLLFVRAEHAHRIRPTYLDGPADLVIEIVSPESIERDYQHKLAEYEAAGIPEYWIVDPLQIAAFFYQLGPDGRYQQVTVGEDGIYTSRAVADFRLRTSWLWQRPFPTPAEALADLPDTPTLS